MRKIRRPTAKDIKKLLEIKHNEDVFVPECRVGFGNTLGYIDAWAMRKSWAKPMTWGYEIKVSRRDFVQDDKWNMYLPYCNQFYFVTLAEVAKEEEIPEGVGWMVVASTGGRIFTKRKAPVAQVEPEKMEKFYKAIIMSRAKIQGSNLFDQSRAKDRYYVEEFIRQKEENRHYGRFIRGKLRTLYNEKILKVEQKNLELVRQNENLSAVKTLLEGLGIDPSEWHPEDKVAQLLRGEHGERLRKELRDFEIKANTAVRASRAAMDVLANLSSQKES